MEKVNKERILEMYAQIQEDVTELINARGLKVDEEFGVNESDLEEEIWRIVYRGSDFEPSGLYTVSQKIKTGEEFTKDDEFSLNRVLLNIEIFKTRYIEMKKEADKVGIDELISKKIAELTDVCYKMLEYKNRKIDENWSFDHLLENTCMHFIDFRYSFENVIFSYKYHHIKDTYYEGDIPADKIDMLCFMDDLISELIDPEYGYKYVNKSQYELPIDDSSELKALVEKTDEKILECFKKMLEYVSASRKSNDIFDSQVEVKRNYPWFKYYVENAFNSNYGTSYVEEYLEKIALLEKIENFEETSKEDVDFKAWQEAIEKRKKMQEEKGSKEIPKEEDPYFIEMNEFYELHQILFGFDEEDLLSDYDEDFEEILEELDDEEE